MADTASNENLEALLIVMNDEEMLLVSGNGEVIAPDDGIWLSVQAEIIHCTARAMKKHNTEMSAKEIAESALNIAADICVFTNHNIIVEEM